MTTAYKSKDVIGVDLTSVHTSPQFAVGTIIGITNLLTGQSGEAIYVKSSDAILEGSLVQWDLQLGTATLAPATGGVGSVGAALAAIPNLSYGWVQISGTAKVKSPNAVVAGANVFMLAATPGSVDDAAVAGEQILNAKFSTTTPVPESGHAWVQMNRPFFQGQIT